MVGWILSEGGFDPSIIVGAELCENGSSGRFGRGPWSVVESCEFNHSFLDLRSPHTRPILNIETDHFDCYADLPSVVRAFAEFAGTRSCCRERC